MDAGTPRAADITHSMPPARSGGRDHCGGHEDELRGSLSKYQKKLAKAEKLPEDEEELERLRSKVAKYAAKLREFTATCDGLKEQNDDEEWFTDVSAEAVAARALDRGRL